MQQVTDFVVRVRRVELPVLGYAVALALALDAGCSQEQGARAGAEQASGTASAAVTGAMAGAAARTSAAAAGTSVAAAGRSGLPAAAAGTGGAAASPAAMGGVPSAAAAAGIGASSATAGSAGGAPAAAGVSASPSAAAGSGGSGGSSTQPPAAATCGGAQPNLTPFGCKFAWGTNDPGSSLGAFAGLSFVSKWIGYELDKAGNLPRCDGCSWLTQQVQGSALVPVYYAYLIGFFGKANGLPDGNENPNGPNLTTDAAKLIRTQRAGLLNAYSSYAKQTAAVWRDKPLVWLLEGDFVQYAGDTQKEKLSYAELGELARDITCAIKSQMPNAVVAINHSTWNSDQVTNDFWSAMKSASYDLVWTTGVANNQGFFEQGADAGKYNAKTATYAYLRMLTGRSLFVDTSFGLSEMADSWSGADAATLNARIAEGVIAANVTKPPADYVSKVGALGAQLDAVCK